MKVDVILKDKENLELKEQIVKIDLKLNANQNATQLFEK